MTQILGGATDKLDGWPLAMLQLAAQVIFQMMHTNSNMVINWAIIITPPGYIIAYLLCKPIEIQYVIQ